MSKQSLIRLRLFGLRASGKAQVEQEVFPFSPELTVGKVWNSLQSAAEPQWPMASLQRDLVLALVNGRPIHLLKGWETPVNEGDTITFLPKAFGG